MERKYLLKGEDSWHLAPLQFPWAWEMVKQSLENTWVPAEVAMGSDKLCYEHALSTEEKHLFTNVFATLTTADLAIASNVTERLYCRVKAAEVKAYMGRQIAEEVIHSLSYQHVIEVLGLDQEDTYSMYQRVPEIRDWFDFAQREYTREDVLLPLIFQYAIFEGVFFLTGFAAIYGLQRIGKMMGTCQQIQYIHRDESMHIAFGMKLLREMFLELNTKPDPWRVYAMFRAAMARLDAWADRCVPSILGYNASLHKEHARYLANNRLQQLGYAPMWPAGNVLPWLDEQAAINKEKNFFETRVTEYRNASALHDTWD